MASEDRPLSETELWYARMTQQARCPVCDAALNGIAKHIEGCEWLRRQYEGMQNTAPKDERNLYNK